MIRSRRLLRESFDKQEDGVTNTDGLTLVDKNFLKKLDEIIRDNYQNIDFSMDDIVEIMHISRSSFYRKIKGILDLSPNDYIRIHRLKKAAELLRAGEKNITEVCFMVGFSAPSYFAKCFKKQYGVLPKDYPTDQNPKI